MRSRLSEIEYIKQLSDTDTRPFSRATKANGFIFVSGISAGIQGTATEETRASINNIKNILEAAGSSLERVVEMTMLITNPADYQEINLEYIKHFKDPRPARHTARFGVPTQAKVAFACIALENKQD